MGGGGERVCKEKKMQSNGSQVVVVEGRGVVRKNKFRKDKGAGQDAIFLFYTWRRGNGEQKPFVRRAIHNYQGKGKKRESSQVL